MGHQDWTYHGVDGETGVITVMTTQHGPTERERSSRKLRVIKADWHGPLGWGYQGGSPGRTAHALLTDALAVDRDEVAQDLIRTFLTDVVSNLTHEFRLRRAAVLRWVRGYYAELGKPCPYAIPNIP